MQPFKLTNAAQFRPHPPPAMDSATFTADFNEVKTYGAKDSTGRTAEQTANAYFWNANVINMYNQALRDVATQHSMDLVDTVHLLAMGEMVTSDAGIACFDAKYRYLLRRPYTAIRDADLTGNRALVAEPNWQPLVSTPNHPEYPSAYGCLTSAFAEAVSEALQTRRIDVTLPGAKTGGTTLATTRHFDTVADIELEVVKARVWIGFHYRSSAEAGVTVGTDVARWELQRYFLPLKSGAASSNSFTVSFSSTAAGDGRVYFGSGPGCQGLVETATQDELPGTKTHAVTVSGNDLAGSIGSNGIQPGTTYWYETVTMTRSGEEIDNNGGACHCHHFAGNQVAARES